MSSQPPVVPCELSPETAERISQYASALEKAGPDIGDHGLDRLTFIESGLFQAAIERLRGQRSATTRGKLRFVEAVLLQMRKQGFIDKFEFTGGGERHDLEVYMPDGWVTIVETKGCMDGNNTNIFERPANADEFVIWSLCQNTGSDPRKNVYSGLHTRIGAEVIHRRQLVDGVVVWDMLCGTMYRPCPKVLVDGSPQIALSHNGIDASYPPPCIYLLPRSVPDPRNNPKPPSHTLKEVRFLEALHQFTSGSDDHIVTLSIEARMKENSVQRRTIFARRGDVIHTTGWGAIKRASR